MEKLTEELEFKEINTIVVTIADPLMEVEAILLQELCNKFDLEVNISESGKLIYAETDALEKLLIPLAQFGLGEDILHIKHTKEYYSNSIHPEYGLLN